MPGGVVHWQPCAGAQPCRARGGGQAGTRGRGDGPGRHTWASLACSAGFVKHDKSFLLQHVMYLL